MRTVRAVNVTRQIVLAHRVAVADSFLRRGWGLLGRASLAADQGMLITNTNCIHSMFMRFPFDAVYIDRDGMVCLLAKHLAPNRVGPIAMRARHVLELPAGTIENTGTLEGDVIVMEE